MPLTARKARKYHKNRNSGQINTDSNENSCPDQKNYRETVHVVDINGRVIDHPKTPRPIDDFSKSLPRNYFIKSSYK